MLGTVLNAFLLTHLVLMVGSTFIPVLQNWKLRHRKDKDLPRSPGGGVAEPGLELLASECILVSVALLYVLLM